MSRRIFLSDLGKGGVAVAIGIGFVTCGGDAEQPGAVTAAASTTQGPSPTSEATAAAGATTASDSSASTGGSGLVAVEWERANLGNVPACVLARGGEATIVDTGTANNEGAIDALGLGWDAVGHVIVTHLHGDYAGSLSAVLEAAPAATAYAGTADVSGIRSPRELVGLNDGDRVFDLDIIGTPGHTAGHISVHDPVGRILFAGDSINGADGGVVGPNSRFTPDMTIANQSVAMIATLDFETILFGYGEPVLTNGTAQIAALVS